MNTPGVQFWFEFGSTYSYLAAARIEAAAAEAGVPVAWEPFLLGPIFAEQGWEDSPFNVYPAKGRYMWRDMERLCSGQGIPFAKPSRFPRSGVAAARVACLAKAASEPWLARFTRAVFRANLAEDREIGDAAEIRAILGSLGLAGASSSGRAPPITGNACESRPAGRSSLASSAPRVSWSATSSSGATTAWRTPWRGRPADARGSRRSGSGG
ncbi:MAG TPA: DsbA family protein [Rubrobacter sp.]|nr:DsbA family protein [Rubrobacter sp.]